MDRRALPRNDAGRRDRDRASTDLVTPAAEQGLGRTDSAARYVLLTFALFLMGLYGVRAANTALAPMLHDDAHIERAAEVLASGQSYLTHDLNIETRRLRHQHIAKLDRTPYVAIMGASHWQEAHAELGRGVDLYNAHVHRDYYEDILGVSEMFVKHARLPKRLIISIRDNMFTKVEDRTDWLWVPILDDYRAMAARLGIDAHDHFDTPLKPRFQQTLSLPLLKANVERYLEAPVKPGPSDLRKHPTLDTLLPDGSISWSILHDEGFTPGRARGDALSFAYAKRDAPPPMYKPAIDAVDKMLEYLVARGVEVYLAHPPFNPIYWDAVQDSPYSDGLKKVEALTRDFAAKYGLEVIGGFDPRPLGCSADQYIDGEHSNPECLQVIVDQFLEIDARKRS
jgi:hypothetical protein